MNAMKTFVSPAQRPDTGTVVAIGSFDGVHLGHQALIAQLKARSRIHRVPSVVYTFDPPTRVLTQGVEFLCTLPEKLELLQRYGVDETVAVPFTAEFASRPKDEFLNDLRLLRPHVIVVGEDFHFGRGRAGGVEDLRAVAPVEVVPIHGLSGEDIKSTRIREYLREGDVAGARRLLGRHYDAQGVVVQGDQLGRTIGWPTANIRVPEGKALPLGVFAVVVLGPRGERWHGMANVGMRPTVNGTERRFEVHLFGVQQDLYGQELHVKFFTHLRGEQKFSGLDELKAQLSRDAAAAQTALSDA